MPNPITITQPLPEASASEQAVIGCVLLEPDTLSLVEHLRPHHFARSDHALIWQAIQAVPVADLNNVADHLGVSGNLQKIGAGGSFQGKDYLDYLMTVPFHSDRIKGHAEQVFSAWLRRKAIENAVKAIEAALDPKADFLTEYEELVAELGHLDTSRNGFRDWDTINASLISRVKARREGLIPLIKTGFIDLDELMGGLEPGMQYLVAARTHIGKTEFTLSMARNLAHQGMHIAIFTPEQAAEQIIQRLHQMENGKWSSSPFRDPGSSFQSDAEYQTFIDELNKLSLPIYVDDYPSLTPMYVYNTLKKLHREWRVDVAIVDRGNLMDSGDRNGRGRTEEVQSIGKTMKANARLLNIPIIETAQIVRAVEDRKDKRPRLSDIYYGGEQDADIIFLLYREDVYNPGTGGNLLEINIGKDRIGGRLGVVQLIRDSITGRLSTVRKYTVNLNSP